MPDREGGDPTPEAIARALEAHPWYTMPALPGRRNHLAAPVLLPLVWNPTLQVLTTLRPAHLDRHPNEVCFPGGRPEEGDVDMYATATREAYEEVGIESPRRLGRLSSIPLYTSDYRLEPFVGAVAQDTFVASPDEVESILMIPILDALSVDAVDGIAFDLQGSQRLSPIFDVQGHCMYGATAWVLYELLAVLAPLYDRVVPPLKQTHTTWADVLPKPKE